MTPDPSQWANRGESHLLLEVADGVLVGVGEEVENAVLDVILLQVVHQVSAIALQGRGRAHQAGGGRPTARAASGGWGEEGRDRREPTGKEVGTARGSESGRRKGDRQRKGSL